MIGKTVSHYRIVEKLGGGGMGVVYKAEDTKLKRTVALKFLPPELTRDEEAKKRFIREAQAAAALDHPNICTIYEVGEADGQAYIAMELVSGEALSERLSGERMVVDEVLRMGNQMADALAHAHSNGVVHRDFKSGNVVITPEGRAKVLDFGLAKLFGDDRDGAITEYGLLRALDPDLAGDPYDRIVSPE